VPLTMVVKSSCLSVGGGDHAQELGIWESSTGYYSLDPGSRFLAYDGILSTTNLYNFR